MSRAKSLAHVIDEVLAAHPGPRDHDEADEGHRDGLVRPEIGRTED